VLNKSLWVLTKQEIVKEDVQSVLNDIEPFSKALENKHVLISGGRGFLGTYFLKVLTELNKVFEKPIHITVLDNLITAKEKEDFHDKNIKFIEQDISQKFTLSEKLHYIIHSASIASPPIYRKYPLKTVDVNYQGTRNLLDLAVEKRIESMLFLSSSEIYGDPDVIPTPESYWGYVSSTGPRACYDESKRLAETISVLYHQEYGVPVKIARPFNVYGPYLNLDDGRMIPDFMKNAIEKSEIIIHSDGSPTRSFCYITDAMRGFFRILLLATPGSIFNVGNDEEISVKEVAEIVRKMMNKPIKIIFQKSSDPHYVKDNPQRRCPDLTNISKAIGYKPQVKLEEGIRCLYNWYESGLS